MIKKYTAAIFKFSIQWKFSGQLCFSGQAQVAQRSWMIKNMYSIQWKNSGNAVFFKASASCSKILNPKAYPLQWKFSGQTLFFRSSASCSKILNVKKCIQYSEKFKGKLCFSGKGEKILHTVHSASKGNYRKVSCRGEHSTQGTSPLELTSKVTTQFAYNGTSRGMYKERYCRIEMHVEDAIGTEQNVTL